MMIYKKRLEIHFYSFLPINILGMESFPLFFPLVAFGFNDKEVLKIILNFCGFPIYLYYLCIM